MVRRLGAGLRIIPTSARPAATTAPVNDVAPSIPSPLTQGQTVAINPGSWSGLPSGGYQYQKQRWNGSSWDDVGSLSSSPNITFDSSDVAAGASGVRAKVSATNDLGTGLAYSAAVTIAPPLSISGTPGAASVGLSYSFTSSSPGGHTPKTYALTGTLPSGLSFNTSTGAITGTPVSSGTSSGLNITVTDADGLTAALGTFSIVVSSGVTFQSENRPATIAASNGALQTGDSWEQGNGAPAPNIAGVLSGLLGGATSASRAVGGMSWGPIQGAHTSPIWYQYDTLATPTERTYHQFTGGSQNGHTGAGGTLTASDIYVWVDYITTKLAADFAPIAYPQWWTYFLGVWDTALPGGSVDYTSWQWLRRQLEASYGAHFFDRHQYLQFRGPTAPNSMDRKHIEEWDDMAISFRGQVTHEAFDYAYTATQTDWVVVSTATNTSAGIAAAVSPTVYPNGTRLQNIGSGAAADIWTMTASGSWLRMDPIHGSQAAFQEEGKMRRDIIAAVEGRGAPIICPGRVYGRQDAAAGTSFGTVYYIGNAAPTSVAIFDMSGNPITAFTVTDNGVTNGNGSLTISRSATGTLTEGRFDYQIQTTDAAGHVLHGPLRIIVGPPSTRTAPVLRAIPATSPTTPDGDFCIAGRRKHGLADGNKVFIAFHVKPSAIGDNQYIINSGTFLNLRIGATGHIALSMTINGVLTFNNATIVTSLAANDKLWFAGVIDLSTSTPTFKGRWKKNAGANATFSAPGVPSTGGITAPFSNTFSPVFLSLGGGASWKRAKFATSDSSRDQLTGAWSNIIMGNGDIDIFNTASVADILWDSATGNPAARVQGSAINGQTPVWDIRYETDLLNGGVNPTTEPVFCTARSLRNGPPAAV